MTSLLASLALSSGFAEAFALLVSVDATPLGTADVALVRHMMGYRYYECEGTCFFNVSIWATLSLYLSGRGFCGCCLGF